MLSHFIVVVLISLATEVDPLLNLGQGHQSSAAWKQSLSASRSNHVHAGYATVFRVRRGSRSLY